MRRVLVIANQTVVGSHLLSRVHALKDTDADVEVFVIVPVTAPKNEPKDGSGTSSSGPLGLEQATDRLDRARKAFANIGVGVAGRLGHADPMRAAEQAMEYGKYDLIVVSTLAPGMSRWISMDLPHRLERRYKLPVEHVIGEADVAAPSRPSSGSVNVLLIEDQPADVALTKQAFAELDHDVEVRVATNGAEAIEYLRAHPTSATDLILLDLNMPVLNGHQFLQQIDDEIGVSKFNVVVLTTSTSDADRERAHALGAAAYVVKDPDFDVFRDTLASLVNEVAKV